MKKLYCGDCVETFDYHPIAFTICIICGLIIGWIVIRQFKKRRK